MHTFAGDSEGSASPARCDGAGPQGLWTCGCTVASGRASWGQPALPPRGLGKPGSKWNTWNRRLTPDSIACTAVSLSALTAHRQGTTLPAIPDGVVYRPKPAEEFVEAGEVILACLRDPECVPPGGALVIGPRIALEPEPDQRVQDLHAAARIQVPMQAEAGPSSSRAKSPNRLTNRRSEGGFSGPLPLGATPRFQRPTYDELATYWTHFSFDIDDPMFIVETERAERVLMQALPDACVL